jgi:hypothetical protein
LNQIFVSDGRAAKLVGYQVDETYIGHDQTIACINIAVFLDPKSECCFVWGGQALTPAQVYVIATGIPGGHNGFNMAIFHQV